MMKTNDSFSDSNLSLYTKENKGKTSSGYFPLLKFKENLYNSCQTKFSNFLNRSNDIKLVINNKINKKISINDYITNSCNNLNESKLTPIPYINKRKLKNNIEKRELKNFQRNVVFMRRLEYTNKMNEKKIKKKYKNQVSKIITIQKVIRGYLVRKVIYQINIIKETLANFVYSIRFCIIKKYFYIFNKNVENSNTYENEEKTSNNCNMNIYNENTSKNSINIDANNKEDNENKNKDKYESIIDNDDYVEFSSKKSIKNAGINKNNNNKRNRNPQNELLEYQLSSFSSLNQLKRTKTQTIQRHFRKYLTKIGYYGKFDKRKIAIIYLIKYMIINNIKSYILKMFQSFYKEIIEMKSTQEENYYNMSSEIFNELNKNYKAAINELV